MASATQDRNYYVVKSNALIQKSRFSLSLQAQRCLLYAISRIKISDIPSTEYTFRISDICNACGIEYSTHSNYYNIMKAELKALRDNSIWIMNEEGKEETVSWFSKVKMNKGQGTVSIKFDETIQDYLFLLQNKYTQYKLSTPLAFKSKYSIRLYELLLSYTKKSEIERGIENEVYFSPDELKERMDGGNYKKFYDFRRFVIEKSIEEINQYSDDIHAEYTCEYKGKQIKKIYFYITSPRAKQIIDARENRRKKFSNT
jgi:plasmid replication initiation protein